MHTPYPGYPGMPTDEMYPGPHSMDPAYYAQHYNGASFGAENDATPADSLGISPAPLSNGWTLVKLFTPDWVKQSLTIAVGVFGGLCLSRMFSHRVPANK